MSKTIYAVLIGINGYQRKPLGGCLNDVIDTKAFFEDLASTNPNLNKPKLQLLLAPRTDPYFKEIDNQTLKDANILTADYMPPTRANILASFDHFSTAKPGDICLIYYSGHGSFQDAPPEFWHTKSARQVETIVAVDSRLPNGRDIVDKELGYQIWSTMKDKKDVHFLAIMDCCHAGDNTRDTENIVTRDDQPNKNNTILSQYFGFKEGGNDFYKYSEDGKQIDVKYGAHVHLAGARENESAKELDINGQQRGIFTYNLLKTLRNGGVHYDYHTLMERIKIQVENRVTQQIPLGTASGTASTKQKFLSTSLIPPAKVYAIFKKKEEWLLNAGQIHSIFPSSELGTTIINILHEGVKIGTAEVIKTKTTTAVLEVDDAAKSKIKGLTDPLLKGSIHSLAAPKLKVGIEEETPKSIKDYFLSQLPSSAVVDYVESDKASHIIRALNDDLVLTKKGSTIPLFRRQSDPELLLKGIEAVAQWQALLEMDNPNTTINKDELDITVEVIEGQAFDASNIDALRSKNKLENPAEIAVKYKEDDNGILRQPAIRLSIKCKSINRFIGGLYLSSQFGITDFLSTTEIKKNGGGEPFKIKVGDSEFKTIPLAMNDKYHDYGITEVTNYIKIFVATKHFDLSKYIQNNLPLDEIDRTRNILFEKGIVTKNVEDWTTITLPIKMTRPASQEGKTINLANNKKVLIGSTTLSVPANFSAKLTVVSKNQVKKMLDSNENARSMSDTDRLKLNATLLPPATLWGSTISGDTILSRNTIGESDAQLSVLEFEEVTGTLTLGEAIELKPEGLKVDESIIPFGYDAETGLYIPVGFTDRAGIIRIENLPPPTEGKILDNGMINRGTIGASIKLFLKKIIWNPLVGDPKLNKLRRCTQSKGQLVVQEPIEDNYLQQPEIKNVALLIHGIIGTTESLVDGFYYHSDLNNRFDEVLSYDYENLNTPIGDTAKKLKEALERAGLFEVNAPRLTIIAHSMGGLVTRYLIEKLDRGNYVKKLIQLGTPNGGSELSDFRKSLFSLITLSLNGVARLKSFLPSLINLGKGSSKNIFVTLNQMSPSSDFFTKELNVDISQIDTSKYHLIAGNTALIKVEHEETEPFWSVFIRAVKQKGHYLALGHIVFDDLNHDMAVRIDQMQNIYPTESNISILAADHISYFVEPESLKKLAEIIDKEGELI